MLHSSKSELKQEVAVEAAQDPNSNVTAQDAERVLVDESKKAGVAALQFDPNATPEEKAAQAKAVSSKRPAMEILGTLTLAVREPIITNENLKELALRQT
jgi:hypothetical protein